MAGTEIIIEKAHKCVTLKAQKKAHSVDERSERSVAMCLLAIFCLCFSSFADQASDIASIKQDVQRLRGLINDQTIWFYNWDLGEQKTAGTQQAIAFTLRNIAIGLHDSILPAIESIGNNTTNLVDISTTLKAISDSISTLDYNVSQLAGKAEVISQQLDNIQNILGAISIDISQGLYGLLQELTSLRQLFDSYKDLALTYLQSIDNNVGVIANLQTQSARYIEGIYNSISAGINVNLANGIPEPIDYTALLERISHNNLWGNYDDYSHNRVGNRYISGGITWTYLNDLSTNTVVKDGINLSGDFFSDVVDLLSCSDEKLAAIQKSLMILCQNTQSNNVRDVDIDAEATDGVPSDKMDDPNDITSGLSFQSSSGYLTLPEIKGLDGKQCPTFLNFEVPHIMGIGGGTISANLTKYIPAIEQARNLLLFLYWGITAILFVLLYRLFSKYVLSNLLKLAFAFVQKGKSV